MKGDDYGDNDNAGEGEGRMCYASLEDASNNDKIYSAITAGQGTTTTKAKSAKDEDDKDGCMVEIH